MYKVKRHPWAKVSKLDKQRLQILELSDKKYKYIKLHEKKLENEKERKRDYIMAKNI